MTYKHTLEKLPKNTFKIAVTIPWDEVQTFEEKAFKSLLADFSYEGFRKGKVPEAIARKNIPERSVYEKALQLMLPDIYKDILTKEDLRPVIDPKIELVKAGKDEEWEVVFHVAGPPTIDLGDYKKIIADAKSESKADDIWVPGKEEKSEKQEEKNAKKVEVMLKAIFDKTPFEISDLILEEDLNRKLSQLVDNINNLGLTTESYLKSKGLTMDQLKEQYRQEIESGYKMEFILQAIADKESISVEEKDFEDLYAQMKDEKQRELAKKNSYAYAPLLRKQKVLDYLSNL